MQARFIRNLFVLCMCCSFAFTSNAQQASRIYVEPTGWSIGLQCGLSDLWGNVGTQSPIQHYTNSKYFDKVAFMGGMFGRYTIHPAFALRGMINYGTIYATDAWNYDLAKTNTTQGQDAYQRYARAQDAKDIMFEGSLLMEISPKRINPESRGAHKRGQPYLCLGITYFHFTPYSTVAASPTWVKTYDLDLEGQGWGAGYPPAYKLWQFAIPLAIGYRWDLGEHLNLGLEWMWRKTFTSYLDGVSGPYIGASEFKAHLNPQQALLAEQVEDKGFYTGLSLPNTPGNLRGNAGFKDSYSTLSIVFYYKVASRNREWWH
jgi:hypothetical protein